MNKRVIEYGSVAAVLLAGSLVFSGTEWRGSAALHTVMETAATLLAWIVGALALVRYYTKRENLYLLIGMGFTGAGLFDGALALLGPEFIAPIVAWGWTAGLHYVAPLIFAGLLAGILKLGNWRTGALEHWLFLAVVAGFAGQAAFLAQSRQLFGFYAAHGLKLLGAGCVLAGLIIRFHAVLVLEAGSNERYTQVVANTAEGVVTIDNKGIFESVNPVVCTLFG